MRDENLVNQTEGKSDSVPGAADPRCLQHDHHWLDEDLYDEDSEGMPVALLKDVQLAAKCTRCGKSMRDSFAELIAECRQMIDGRFN